MAAIASCPPLTRESVQEARRRIQNHIHRTPILSSSYIDRLASTPREGAGDQKSQQVTQVRVARPRMHIMLKCENFQRIGAFKPRGAFNALLRYEEDIAKDRDHNHHQEKSDDDDRKQTTRIISHSSGNHAQAVALAAHELGYQADIVMPSISAPAKIAATKGYGANVHFSGPSAQERLAVVDALLADDEGGKWVRNVFVPPYDHPDTMLGQGTIGLEIQDQVREEEKLTLHAIMTPCGGGGLLSGTALSCAGTGIVVFGAEPGFQGADDCRRGLLAGKRVETVASNTIADGLRTPVGQIPWSIISDPEYVRAVYAVTEQQIRDAWRLVAERMKLLVEPSSVVPLAAALYNEEFRRVVEEMTPDDGETTFNLVLVVTGGNVTLEAIPELLKPADM